MIKIVHHGNGYRMTFSFDRHWYHAQARNTTEIGAAVRHYYSAAHTRRPIRLCPLCRLMAKDKEKDKRRTR